MEETLYERLGVPVVFAGFLSFYQPPAYEQADSFLNRYQPPAYLWG
jgi:predicted solute-binding protein